MSIFRLAAELFLIYILYQLIFEFIIPIYNSTKKIRNQFNDLHEKIQKDMDAANTPQSSFKESPKVKREGDYIEFEEIK